MAGTSARGTRALSPGPAVIRSYPKWRPGHPGLLPCQSGKDWHPEDRVVFFCGPKGAVRIEPSRALCPFSAFSAPLR